MRKPRGSVKTLTVDGVTRTITEWAKITGIKRHTLYTRKIEGWTDEQVVKTPCTCQEYHGHFRGGRPTPERNVWNAMIQRCTNPNNTHYDRYGGRGVTVCKRWTDSFQAFFDDMGPRPFARAQLDRFPNKDGNYEPGNVRWATSRQNNNNRTNNRILEFRGESHTLAEWAAICGLPVSTIGQRLSVLGWSVERSLTTPKRRMKSRVPS